LKRQDYRKRRPLAAAFIEVVALIRSYDSYVRLEVHVVANCIGTATVHGWIELGFMVPIGFSLFCLLRRQLDDDKFVEDLIHLLIHSDQVHGLSHVSPLAELIEAHILQRYFGDR